MELKEAIEMDINDTKKLKLLGYDDNNYYGGFWEMMKYVSKAYRYLKKKFEFKSIFNDIFFWHDYCYSFKPNLEKKKIIDKKMYDYMMNRIDLKFEIVQDDFVENMYRRFAEFCYKAVCWFTPIYLLMGKVRW